MGLMRSAWNGRRAPLDRGYDGWEVFVVKREDAQLAKSAQRTLSSLVKGIRQASGHGPESEQ